MRSKVVHKGSHASRAWGWSPFEHLVMAGHVFPLTVKLLLAGDGHYHMTDEDRVRCLAIDKLLASPRWGDDGGAADESWVKIVSKVRRDLEADRTWKAMQRSAGGAGGSVSGTG